MAKSSKKRGSTKGRQIQLVVSNDTNPAISVEVGTQIEVVGVSLIKPTGQVAPSPMAARLCGGTSTCLALIKIAD